MSVLCSVPAAPRPFLSRSSFPGGRWLGLVAAGILTVGTAVAAPVSAFALNDLNERSERIGQSISPRDYGQWISAYYFGNEG